MIAFFRQKILPFLTIIVFLIALVAVSARGFLASDMVAPAPNDNLDVPESLYTEKPLQKDNLNLGVNP